MITTQYKKTRKGKIMKFTHQVYLRNDIPCGYDKCEMCEPSCLLYELISGEFSFEDSESARRVYILDHDLVMHQLDLLENFPPLKNVIILQSIVNDLMIKFPNLKS